MSIFRRRTCPSLSRFYIQSSQYMADQVCHSGSCIGKKKGGDSDNPYIKHGRLQYLRWLQMQIIVSLPILIHITACCATALAGLMTGRELLMVAQGRYEATLLFGSDRTFTSDLVKFTHTRFGLLDPGSQGSERTALLSGRNPSECTWDLAKRWNFSDDSPIDPVSANLHEEDEVETLGSKSRVGRHGILIRKNPHPDMKEVMRSHSLLKLLQRNQLLALAGRWDGLHVGQKARNQRRIIAITPTYKRTFQTMHMLGLMNSLKSAEGGLLWIVVEAGGKTEETAALLERSGLGFVHLSVEEEMKGSWGERMALEQKMREEGMRYVRVSRLSGAVIFPDDTSVLSPRFFSEARSVHWIGAASVGVLLQAGFTDLTQLAASKKRRLLKQQEEPPSPLALSDSQTPPALQKPRPRYPVQGPVCSGSSVTWNHSSWSFPFPLLPIKNGEAPNSRGYYPGSPNYTEPELVGWHTMVGATRPEALVRDVVMHPQQSLMEAEEASTHMEEAERHERSSMQWLGFVVNARLLWSDVQVGRGGWGAGRAPVRGGSIPSWLRAWSPDSGEEDGAGEGGSGTSTSATADVSSGGEAATSAVAPPVLEGKDPLSVFVLDERKVQTLGDCGRKIMAWWIRADARADSKFYRQWTIDPQLEMVVKSKSTPWPDPLPPPPPSPPPPPAPSKHSKKSSKTKPKKKKQKEKKAKEKKMVTKGGELPLKRSKKVLFKGRSPAPPVETSDKEVEVEKEVVPVPKKTKVLKKGKTPAPPVDKSDEEEENEATRDEVPTKKVKKVLNKKGRPPPLPVEESDEEEENEATRDEVPPKKAKKVLKKKGRPPPLPVEESDEEEQREPARDELVPGTSEKVRSLTNIEDGEEEEGSGSKKEELLPKKSKKVLHSSETPPSSVDRSDEEEEEE